MKKLVGSAKKPLTLSAETIRKLDRRDLAGVAGGALTPACPSEFNVCGNSDSTCRA